MQISNREFGLVHNDSDQNRFVRQLSYELDLPAQPLYANATTGRAATLKHAPKVVPVVRVKEFIDIGHRDEPLWKLTTVSVTELVRPPTVNVRSLWPGDWPGETEYMRRERIRAIRRVIHIDFEKQMEEPDWMPEP